jgi:hypothetical protein
MDGASVCRKAAEVSELSHLYRHCFAHCLMLVFKDNQHIFTWIDSIIKIIRMITRNGKLLRGSSSLFADHVFVSIMLSALFSVSRFPSACQVFWRFKLKSQILLALSLVQMKMTKTTTLWLLKTSQVLKLQQRHQLSPILLVCHEQRS